MNETQFREVLRMHIVKKYKRQAAAAQAWGVSGSLVSMVLRGEKNPNDAMLQDVGFERIQPEVYFKKMKKKVGD